MKKFALSLLLGFILMTPLMGHSQSASPSPQIVRGLPSATVEAVLHRNAGLMGMSFDQLYQLYLRGLVEIVYTPTIQKRGSIAAQGLSLTNVTELDVFAVRYVVTMVPNKEN